MVLHIREDDSGNKKILTEREYKDEKSNAVLASVLALLIDSVGITGTVFCVLFGGFVAFEVYKSFVSASTTYFVFSAGFSLIPAALAGGAAAALFGFVLWKLSSMKNKLVAIVVGLALLFVCLQVLEFLNSI